MACTPCGAGSAALPLLPPELPPELELEDEELDDVELPALDEDEELDDAELLALDEVAEVDEALEPVLPMAPPCVPVEVLAAALEVLPMLDADAVVESASTPEQPHTQISERPRRRSDMAYR